jgi:hypothetical protein
MVNMMGAGYSIPQDNTSLQTLFPSTKESLPTFLATTSTRKAKTWHNPGLRRAGHTTRHDWHYNTPLEQRKLTYLMG